MTVQSYKNYDWCEYDVFTSSECLLQVVDVNDPYVKACAHPVCVSALEPTTATLVDKTTAALAVETPLCVVAVQGKQKLYVDNQPLFVLLKRQHVTGANNAQLCLMLHAGPPM